MNRNIDDTIKEITLSILKFDTDIKAGDPEGINEFLKIIDIYESYFSLRVPDKYEEKMHYLNFKKEIQDVFTDLFVNDKIFEVAESLFIKNGVIKIPGQITIEDISPLTEIRKISMKLDFAVCKYDGSTRDDIKNIRWEKNPLYNLSDEEYRGIIAKKESGIRVFKVFNSNPFKEFVSKYQALYDNEKTGSKPIIDIDYLSLIYNKYHDYFTEDKDTWINRFIYPNEKPVIKIDIEKEAFNDSNKLVLLGILASIQDLPGNKFDYQKFVLERFGILNYYKTKSDHQKTKTFTETKTGCNKILKVIL